MPSIGPCINGPRAILIECSTGQYRLNFDSDLVLQLTPRALNCRRHSFTITFSSYSILRAVSLLVGGGPTHRGSMATTTQIPGSPNPNSGFVSADVRPQSAQPSKNSSISTFSHRDPKVDIGQEQACHKNRLDEGIDGTRLEKLFYGSYKAIAAVSIAPDKVKVIKLTGRTCRDTNASGKHLAPRNALLRWAITKFRTHQFFAKPKTKNQNNKNEF
jgi:hypothetical protein